MREVKISNRSREFSVKGQEKPWSGISIFVILFFSFLLLMTFWGCMPEKVIEKRIVQLDQDKIKSVLKQIDLSKQGLSSWQELRKPLERSLAYVSAQPSEEIAIKSYGLELEWKDLEDTLNTLLDLLPLLDTNQDLLIDHFQWYKIRSKILFTGYFEPQIEASLSPRPGYPYPIYGLPSNLKVADLGQFHPRWQGQSLVYRIKNGTIHPYYERKSIEKNGSLKGKAETIAWAKDAVDLFFLQIQGSGILQLPDGRTKHIGYAGKNGRKYVSLGRVLSDKGYLELESVSMQSIKEYLGQNQDLLPEILYTNPSYVFFRLRNDGPYGAMGKKIKPLFSLASDPSLLALGSLLVYSVNLPASKTRGTLPLVGLGLVQDVGGAVKGHHLDLFCGIGDKARYTAGHLKDRGYAYILLARDQQL